MLETPVLDADKEFRTRILDQISLRVHDRCLPAMSTLSDRELEVLILTGRNNTTKNIAAMLGLSTKTVETYKSHIKRKLELKNSVQLTIFSLLYSLIED